MYAYSKKQLEEMSDEELGILYAKAQHHKRTVDIIDDSFATSVSNLVSVIDSRKLFVVFNSKQSDRSLEQKG